MAKKTDLRVIRTKKLIKEALLKLIQEKGFDAITVQNIADEAFINRATFYLHFQDKYDLLEQVSHIFLQELMDVINFSFHIENGEVNVERFQVTLKRVFENIEKNRDFYQIMFGPNGVPEFSAKVEKIVFEKFEKKFIEMVGDLTNLEIPADFILNFISSAYIGVVKWWIKEDLRYSSEYMAMQLANVVTRGPMNAIGFKIDFKEDKV
ncbi:MAG: TetR/AcrR family transcriptional regulator [Bacillota bacterium]